MADTLKGIVVILLLVFAFIFYPAYRQSVQVEENIRDSATAVVKEFVDKVRSKGYADPSDYDVFLRSLDATQGVFDIQIEYYKKSIEPTYTNPNDYTTFQDSFHVRYDGYFTKQFLDVLYPNTSAAADHYSRRFNMHAGDLFHVRIISQGETLAYKLRSVFFQGASVPINITYGGMIRSEAP